MTRLLRTIVALLVIALPAHAEDGKTIKAKLDTARQVYEKEQKEFNDEVLAELDRRETAARKDGKKDLVTYVQSEKKALEDEGEYPLNLPQKMQEKFIGIRSRMDAAYKSAMKEYLVAKLDQQADATEKELDAFYRGLWRNIDLGSATLKDDTVRMPRDAIITTKKEYTGAVDIVAVARTEAYNIRLHAHRGSCVIFNWEGNRGELRLTRPDGEQGKYESGTLLKSPVNALRPNTWYKLRWRLTENGMAVYVNDQRVFVERAPYNLSEKSPIALSSFTSRLEIKAFRVLPHNPLEKD